VLNGQNRYRCSINRLIAKKWNNSHLHSKILPVIVNDELSLAPFFLPKLMIGDESAGVNP
jgi:hypothetical protein